MPLLDWFHEVFLLTFLNQIADLHSEFPLVELPSNPIPRVCYAVKMQTSEYKFGIIAIFIQKFIPKMRA